MRKSVVKYGDTVKQASQMLFNGTPMIVFDLETTGLSKIEDRIISFSALKVVYRNDIFVVIDEKNIFINPEREIPAAVTAINGIDYDRIKDCPTEEEVIEEIREFFGDNPFICGYNSSRFDQQFIEKLYLRNLGEDFKPSLHLDVLFMAKEKVNSSSHHLSDIAEMYGVDGGLRFHNSLDDVTATFRLFKMLLKEYTEDEQKPLYQLRVKKASLYNPSHRVNRIYINTYPYSKTYFDLYKKEWQSDMDCDVDYLEKELYEMYQVTSIQALGKKLATM